MLRTSSIRSTFNTLKKIHRTSSTATPAVPSEKNGSPDDTSASATSSPSEEVSHTNSRFNTLVEKRKSSLVSAAFASLKNLNHDKKPSKIFGLDEKILNCKTPEELLSLTQKSDVNRKQALKIVTTLAEWSVNGQANMSTFETDPRFVSLCQLLGRSSNGTPVTSLCDPSKHNIFHEKQGDLSVVLDVKEEDDAAKLASSLTLPQMIKVLNTLAAQKKRSLSLLRALAFEISRSEVKLDVKKSADVLFALASLNFPDEVILEKVCKDLIETIPFCEKPAVISSVSTSLGRLRYRNDRLLDCISEWIVNNKTLCRSQEFVSSLLTLAIVNHVPSVEKSFFDTTISRLTADDLPTASTWLSVVWALVIHGKATNEHYRSVLSQQYVQRILSPSNENSSVALKKKLLNINGAAKFNKDYKGPTLEEDKEINVVPMVRTKEKQLLVSSVLDALATILPSPSYLKNNIDTGMGFLIDAECRLDGKMTPFPLVDKRTGQSVVHKPGKSQRVAIMCWDYHDNTRGRVGLNGASALAVGLLQKSGYRVFSIDHNEYNVKDKLPERVKYLEEKLKRTVCPNS
ncbi:FAST kinase domain-containing protein 4 isoform X2 [Rhodnius prolixus]|uniref:FAST kinase domain-containing protein 4 isoform X2 n=1 Tax=Rhodnius prolixus TaxID=13249 RepID=UPI003D18BE04